METTNNIYIKKQYYNAAIGISAAVGITLVACAAISAALHHPILAPTLLGSFGGLSLILTLFLAIKKHRFDMTIEKPFLREQAGMVYISRNGPSERTQS